MSRRNPKGYTVTRVEPGRGSHDGPDGPLTLLMTPLGRKPKKPRPLNARPRDVRKRRARAKLARASRRRNRRRR